MDPVQLLQEQADAFNARDLDRVIGCYSPDAVVQDGEGNVLAHGHEAISALFGQLIDQSPDLHVEILSRIHVGSWVVEEEHTTGVGLEALSPGFHIPIAYRVEDGKIVKNMGLF
jgi:hypothetical protein